MDLNATNLIFGAVLTLLIGVVGFVGNTFLDTMRTNERAINQLQIKVAHLEERLSEIADVQAHEKRYHTTADEDVGGVPLANLSPP